MKKIAVITGASSGMGKRFAQRVNEFGTFDEVWVIARHKEQLEALRETVPFPVRVLALDLTDRASFDAYAAALAEEPVEIMPPRQLFLFVTAHLRCVSFPIRFRPGTFLSS